METMVTAAPRRPELREVDPVEAVVRVRGGVLPLVEPVVDLAAGQGADRQLVSGRSDPVRRAIWILGVHVLPLCPRQQRPLYALDGCLVVPLAHGFSDPRIAALREAFLDSGSVEGLDLSGVEGMTAPPLQMPRR